MELRAESRNKQITPIGVAFLLTWGFLLLIIIWVSSTFSADEPVVLQIINPFPCEKIENNWKHKEVFETDQTVYICGLVKSNVTDLDGQIQIRVYKDKITSQVNAIFYDNQRIANGEIHMPINTYLFPGKYMVQISAGKVTLGTITFAVIE